MDMMDDAIKYGLERLSYKDRELTKMQKDVIKGYMEGRDVFLCSPTGSGKSLTFEIAPFIFQHFATSETTKCVIIVISPLSSLMKSQVQNLKKRGIRATYLRDVLQLGTHSLEDRLHQITLQDIRDGECDIIFASPESILGYHRDIIIGLSKQKYIKAIFVDEAHCIKKYGKGDKKKKPAYRPHYGKLGEIRSLVGGNIPCIALTATATREAKELIFKDLCLKNCIEININPDKQNITYWVQNIEGDSLSTNFEWLVALLRTRKQSTPRMIIFFRQIKHISEVYEHLETSLGKEAYVPYNEHGPNDDRNRLFDMFHMKTDDDVKESICSSYEDPLGNIRVVLCSTSFSMGLDVKGVDIVIHYGPANDIDDYVQESGRAGRNPQQQCHAILLRHKRCLGSQNISKEMKEYVKISSCRRSYILRSFDVGVEAKHPLHNCCDNCRKRCTCRCICQGTCTCNQGECSIGVPDILEVIRLTQYASDDDESTDVSFDSDDFEEYLARKPAIVTSSEEDN